MERVLTDTNFAEALPATGVALVDFWAAWCMPCRMLSPTVDEIADLYEGRVTVAKCNVDDCPVLADRFGIRSIPTLYFIKDGKAVDSTVGVVSREEIKGRLDKLLQI